MLEHAFDNQAPANGFLAYALGSMPFDVSQLTPESSAKALQRCIVNLSTKNDGAVRVWGKTGGKRLRLRIERACVKLCDEATGHVLHLQALDGIRVWGVNANNDFAYVANETDRSSSPLATVHSSSLTNDDDGDDAISSLEEQLPPLRCHIFHCEQQFDLETNESLTAVKENTSAARLSEAEQIACLLKAEMLRYRREQSGNELGDDWTALDEHSSSAASTPSVELPANSIGRMSHGVSMPANLSSHHLPFTRSIDTPGPGSIRQTMIGNYLGATQVPCPAGVQMLNDAIDRVLEQRNAPIVCLLHITRSSITIENSNSAQTLFECRVRLLSFLGISQLDARVCGFVQQRTRQTFIAHVFECRPNAVHLCRAIETACKARFEACVRAQKAKCASESDEYMPTEVSTSIRTGLNRFAYTRPSSAQIKRTVRNVFAKFLQK